jgi:transketolase
MVLNVHTIKPLDEEALLEAAKTTGAVVSCEEHQVYGGLGGALAEFFAKVHPVPMRMIGIQDRFGESGQPNELMERFGLTANDIVRASKELLEQRSKK